MELDNIEKLIAKYFEANTTVAEEELLKKYFAQGNVPEHLASYTPIFNYFAAAKQEQFDKEVVLESDASAKKMKFNYKWLSVAAVGLLFFGVYFGNTYFEQKEKERMATEYAYQETKKALDFLSENFNKGTEKVAYLNQFEKTKQKIYNNN